ncbi:MULTISPECIES: hypothetical protein [Rhizobium]|uniref:Uncharacterized protein n=1 Tax=Rhizobium leguminosarum bv. trifolii (strain WSM2304) TaxID=395492 RepID=A0ABF7QV01_RHILW|nr:hypothetical protein [Rhizobium leguminosarum]ACI57971.1 hypothetical protein Rleg2_4720 [Rhizobium leguminosarum bv. trifolii WSM2304]
MLSTDKKQKLSKLFDDRLPPVDGVADAYLIADSFRLFAQLENGDLLARLALNSDETMDIAINPVCASRLAATMLDLLSKSGDFVVDLAIYDAHSGDRLARVHPSHSILPKAT